MMFDSLTKYQCVSFNDVLLTVPNLTNNLLGVLLRFIMYKIATIADLQQMYIALLYVKTIETIYVLNGIRTMILQKNLSISG